MRIRRLAVKALLLTCGYACSSQAQSNAIIPAVAGITLTGEHVRLPEALKGKVGVLVVGFSQASRTEVAAWGKRLTPDYRDSNGVLFYEMAMLASVPRLLRGWVVKKIGAEVPDRAKSRFLPLYDHEADWRAVTGYMKPDDAYVLVVDAAGVVRFRINGEVGTEAYIELKKRVEALK